LFGSGGGSAGGVGASTGGGTGMMGTSGSFLTPAAMSATAGLGGFFVGGGGGGPSAATTTPATTCSLTLTGYFFFRFDKRLKRTNKLKKSKNHYK
jgi:hypothetical protein